MRNVVKQRNNFAKLSYEARKRVLFLLFDGSTFDAIRADPVVRKCCQERDLALHSSTFQAIRRSKEYADYEASLNATNKRTDGAKWAAEILRSAGGLQDIADVTQLALLEQLREITESATGDEKIGPEGLLKLANAVSKIKDNAGADKIRALQKRLEQRDAEIEELKNEVAQVRVEMQRKDALIEKLKAAAGTVDGSDVSKEMDRQFGLT